VYATALLPVLLVVEATDVVFAVDSIPAIFAVTRDPFIVFTSNVFAILGLRALYFVLKTIMDLFRFLKVGLGLVLVFVGGKMCVEHWLHVPAEISLLVVVSLLGLSVRRPFYGRRRERRPARTAGPSPPAAKRPAGFVGEAGDDKMNPRE